MSEEALSWLRDDAPAAAPPPPRQPWKILVVDDDDQVLSVTRMVLSALTFLDRPIALIEARSAAEAVRLVADHPDLAVILMDVVMEADDAGLQAVQHIREVLGRRTVRIILRTGQPGKAPENQLMRSFDINDYRNKAELTAEKLTAAVTAALRSYRDLIEVEAARSEMADLAKLTYDRLLDAVESFAGNLCLLDSSDRFILSNMAFRDTYLSARPLHPGDDASGLWTEIGFSPSLLGAPSQGPTPVPSAAFQRQRADGRWFETYRYRTREGGTLLMEFDITERRRDQERLELQSLALQMTANAVFITDTSGTIEWANAALQEISGYALSEIIGSTPRMFKSGKMPPDYYAKFWEEILSGRTVKSEVENRRKDGSRFIVSQTVTPLLDKTGRITHFVAVQDDITHRKEAEGLLRQYEKLETIGSFAGGIAHDFNNILVPIIGLTDMALKDTPPSARNHARLGRVHSAAMRGKDLVARILAFSRREEQGMHRVPLAEIVGETLKLLHAVVPSTIEMRCTVADHPMPVMADTTQISAMLMNLVSNAVDAIGAVPGRISIDVSPVALDDMAVKGLVGPAAPGPYALLAVGDSGCGIDDATMAKIFDPFFTTKSVGKGTGLGLSIVHGIVRRHGGAVGVRTRQGEGTTFSIYLPLSDSLQEDVQCQQFLS